MRFPKLPGTLLTAAVALASCADSAPAPPPWEIWHDLHRLAEIVPGDQVHLRSSYCPSGCRYDRHSDGDWRYLRLDGEEGVIFEEPGAGAVTRIWMTTGKGKSEPLTPSVRLRIYLDGAAEPVVDAPLPDLFNGSTPPFVPPLVGDRLVSSGGNYSYVPIPYRDGCRVTLVGAHEERIWFQLTYHRLAAPEARPAMPWAVKSFTGEEDLAAWAALLDARGRDPWPRSDRTRTVAGEVELVPGERVRLAEIAGPDSLTALRLRLDEESWHDVELVLLFDGEERVRMPLADFFAAGRAGATPARTLLVGRDAEGWLYAYFPMPLFESAELFLTLDGGTAPLRATYEVRRAGRAPSSASALFGAQLGVDERTPPGVDVPLLQLPGTGRWVGLFTELGSVATRRRDYLEGDERIYLDGSGEPTLHGTGTEDVFNGGFYFDQGPFQLALHGAPYHLRPNREDVTAAYRLMLTDAVSFTDGIRAELEGGPTGNLSLRIRSVAYYYLRPRPPAGLDLTRVAPAGRPAPRADAGPPVFADGFESGDRSKWSGSTRENR